MPELPEVETVRQTLEPWLINRKIIHVSCSYAPMMKPSIQAFKKAVEKSTFTSIKRRGKFLIFELNNDQVILSHLRMEGKYFLLSNQESLPKYTIAVFELDNHQRLVYADTRKFGTLHVQHKQAILTKSPISQLGIEPSELMNQTNIKNKIKASMRSIKSILLDQHIIAGVGNIYADEILFRSHIHPESLGYQLSDHALTLLLKETKQVIEEAVRAGGSTIRTYRSPSGIDGLFQHQLLAYGREHLPCLRCGLPLIKIQLHGRGTTYCRHCQHSTRLPWVIGITGEIASGKSTLLNLAKDQGLLTISSDSIVKELYKKPSIQSKLIRLFGKQVIKKGLVDTRLMLSMLANDEHILLTLEQWLHPLVVEKVFQRIQQSKHPIVMVEMPLLFKAGFDRFCNDIIGIDIHPSIQKKRLIKRNPIDGEQLLKINVFNTYQANRHKINIFVSNDTSLSAFKAIGLQLIKKIIADHSTQTV